jgi:hypothetical protein
MIRWLHIQWLELLMAYHRTSGHYHALAASWHDRASMADHKRWRAVWVEHVLRRREK